jgi:hypothetical protein
MMPKRLIEVGVGFALYSAKLANFAISRSGAEHSDESVDRR